MIIRICTALGSGLLFFFAWSGHAWPLAWIAPLPVLWYAFGRSRWIDAASVAFTAFAVGGLYLCVVYRGSLPAGILAVGVGTMAILFALVVLGSKLVADRTSGVQAMLAYPVLVVTSELLVTCFSANGSFGSFAYSQVSFLPVIQIVSIAGLSGVSFVLALVPSAIALALHRPAPQRKQLVVAAGTCLLAVLAFGLYELHRAVPSREVKVGLTASDEFPSAFRTEDATLAHSVISLYVTRVRALAQQGANIVVLPEEVVASLPEWRKQLTAQLANVARENQVTVVAGFRRWDGDTVRNAAEVYYPSPAPRQEYFKQHLVPVLEDGISPGSTTLVIPNDTGVAICKDMDFPELGRRYSRAGAGLLLVPAWDFVSDGWLHASMAIMRGVEGGYSVARSARDGLLTATDQHGRLLASPVSSRGAHAVLVVSVPIGRGATTYSRIGDVFGWLCVAAAMWLLADAKTFAAQYRRSRNVN